MSPSTRLTAGTGTSAVVERCQICDGTQLDPVLFLGYLPPVNQMWPIGRTPGEQPAYPALLLRCANCQLVQLGLVVDPQILFPPEYPYSSGTTRILRENFAELCREAAPLLGLSPGDLVVDVGSNDGTLLSNFQKAGFRVHGIEPTQMGVVAQERGIPTTISFLSADSSARVRSEQGPAKIVTATNVFAHIEDVHSVVENIRGLLADDGTFISESHYLLSLVETLQYDTIYHEHLRYYTLSSVEQLLARHGLEIFFAKRIPTHGGSIRIYAAPKGVRTPDRAVSEIRRQEAALSLESLKEFRRRVVGSKLALYALLQKLKAEGQRIYGIGAPSRASTLVNYVGLDDGILDCVLEIKGSYKIGKYMPGTLIPVVDEARLFDDPPDCALLLSWHIAEELIGKLRDRGYRGRFLIPLPEPRIV
jgi:C-methyltransferase C-terminal domain/Methyltransferase domain/Putative zinc binding domain